MKNGCRVLSKKAIRFQKIVSNNLNTKYLFILLVITVTNTIYQLQLTINYLQKWKTKK